MSEPICLKTYVDSRIDEIKESLKLCQQIRATKFDAMEAAMKESTRLMEIRLEGMNEIRKQLETQAATFLPKNEYIVQHNGLEDKVNYLGKQATKFITRTEMLSVAALVGAAVSAGVMVILHILIGK